MGYAAILVHVQTHKEAKGRLDCACALARSFNATLIGVGAEMFPFLAPDYGYYAMQGEWFGLMRKTAEDNMAKARELFDASAVAAGLTGSTIWESGLRLPIEALAEASRGADLIVASGKHRQHETTYEDAPLGELVVTAGRPVLVTPHDAAAFVGDQVVLAWKDTREARRALTDALPFFERAKAVRVVEICGKGGRDDAELRVKDVAAALARHGVNAAGEVINGVGDVHDIEKAADAFGADLIVAGGYGHSRLGEWVFGGMTRDLLARGKHYVLLSH